MKKNSYFLVHSLTVIILLIATSVFAQREIRVGTQIMLDDNAAPPNTITIKAPQSPSLVSSWTLRLPTTPPPANTGYYLVGDKTSNTRWGTFNQNETFWMSFLNPVTGGNSGTVTPNYNFLGTDDNITFNIRVNNSTSTASTMTGTGTTGAGVVMAITPNTSSPSFVGGFNGNSITGGAQGVTIHGGGQNGATNRITNAGSDYTTILGGQGNTISGGQGGTILGGLSNTVSGTSAVASGNSNIASGTNAIVFGNANTSSGVTSIALGDHVTASGASSLALGQYLTAGAAANAMTLGLGVSGTPLVNNQANSLFVGFATNAASAANPTLAVFGKNVGVGISNPNARLRVKAISDNGALFALDVRDAIDNQPGSHFSVFHYASAGYYAPNNPVTLTRNGGVVGIGDPFRGTEIGQGATQVWPLILDTARVTVRGLGTTSSTFAFEIENGRLPTRDTLIRLRDDGRLMLGTQSQLFNAFTIKGDAGPDITGARNGGLGLDLGNCSLRWLDLQIGNVIRFDFNRATIGSPNSNFDISIMDTTLVGTLDVSQDLHTNPNPAATTDAWQSFSPGGTGAVDHLDIYFANYTANANVTMTLYLGEGTGGGSIRTVTRQFPAVIAGQYITFDFTPYNLFNCGTQMTWRVQSASAFTLQQYDDTPPPAGTGTRATYDFVSTPGGWSHTNGVYDGGKADISLPLIQRDTLCGSVSTAQGPCAAPHNPLTDSIQVIQSVNTYVIDYRFKTYRVKDPSNAIAIKAPSSNHFVGLNGNTTPQGQVDVPSTTGAMILPRMTLAQRNALPLVKGSMVFVTTPGSIGVWGYDNTAGGSWKQF